MSEQQTKEQQVGCEGDDGFLRVHSETETCDVCEKATKEPKVGATRVLDEGDVFMYVVRRWDGNRWVLVDLAPFKWLAIIFAKRREKFDDKGHRVIWESRS